MRTIHKFLLDQPTSTTKLDLPIAAVPLHTEQQGSAFCLWVDLDVDAPRIMRSFQIFGTGHEIPLDAKYIGTFMDESYVWHLFEVLE
jgi:hypothetical protein